MSSKRKTVSKQKRAVKEQVVTKTSKKGKNISQSDRKMYEQMIDKSVDNIVTYLKNNGRKSVIIDRDDVIKHSSLLTAKNREFWHSKGFNTEKNQLLKKEYLEEFAALGAEKFVVDTSSSTSIIYAFIPVEASKFDKSSLASFFESEPAEKGILRIGFYEFDFGGYNTSFTYEPTGENFTQGTDDVEISDTVKWGFKKSKTNFIKLGE